MFSNVYKLLLWSFSMVWMFLGETTSCATDVFHESSADRSCGYNARNFRLRIVGGVHSRRGMWPWQIGLYVKHGGAPVFICGGALISRWWVLTAAHCFYNPETARLQKNTSWYLVKAGDHSLNKKERSQQEIVPQKIMVHPKYRTTAVDFDIALIKLFQAVKVNTFVRTVCLPTKEEGDQATSLANGIVAGWGVTRPLRFGEEPAPHDFSKVLRHAVFTIQNNQFCINRTMINYNSALTFCAGDGKGGIDICKGDSGGAFLRELRRGRNLQWVAVGIVSFGEGCAQKNKYGYFTKVYPFIDWITKSMKDSVNVVNFIQEPEERIYSLRGSDVVFKWVYKKINETVELKSIIWSVENKTDGKEYPLIVERFNGTVTVNPQIPKAYLDRVEKTEQATLVVKGVTYEDTTTFSCLLRTKRGPLFDTRSRIQLVVTGPVSVSPVVECAEVGSSVTVTCTATAVPGQNFTWIRLKTTKGIVDGGQYSVVSSTGSSQLIIKNVSAADHGFYTCDATMNSEQPNRATFYFQVPCKDPPKEDRTNCRTTSYSLAVGDSVTVCCPVSGYPPPFFTWKKHGVQLNEGNSILKLLNLKDEDFGNYTCSATDFRTVVGPVNITIKKKKGALLPVHIVDGTNEKPKLEIHPLP